MNNDLHFSSEDNTWSTPWHIIHKLESIYGKFDLDPCCFKETAKAKSFYTPEDDGLAKDWSGLVFMNPVYNKPEQPCKRSCKKKRCIQRGCISKRIPGQIDWVKKAYLESTKGVSTVCLLPARTDSDIFQVWVHNKATEVLFVDGRITFEGAIAPAPFPSMIVVYKSGINKTEYGTIKF